MNKRKAKELVESETLTFGQLRGAIESARGRGGKSRVNSAVSLERVLEIYATAIASRHDNERVRAFRPDPYTDRPRRTRDFVIAQNIVRDCM